jgi:diguanylate cyclase (GGDEF)-like protein
VTFSGRIIRSCGIVVVACAVFGGASAVAASTRVSSTPPNASAGVKDPVVVRAIAAVDAERALLSQQQAFGQNVPAALRDQIRAADDRGALLLAQLRQAGYVTTQSVDVALGRLPRPAADGHPNMPGPDVYQHAIDDLETMGLPAHTASSSKGSKVLITVVLIIAVAALVGVVVLLAIVLRRRRHDATLAQLAHSDSLTGLANRRRLDDDLHACRRDRRQPVAVMMVDVDNFKVINDTHGHAAGDRILQAIGTLLAAEVRSKDVVYRYGGEEFCILLPGAQVEEAMRVAERICRSTAELTVPVSGHVTVSVGVALGVAADVMRTLGEADSALFEAKRGGRNRVFLASGDEARQRDGLPVG